MKVQRLAAVMFLVSGAAAGAQSERYAIVPFIVPSSSVRFTAPADWHVLGRDSSAEQSAIIFHVRLPSDSSFRDRANVMVVVRNRPKSSDFRALTDTLFGDMYDGKPGDLVMGDTMPSTDRRFLFWRGTQGKTTYLIFDDFGRRGMIVVHVRMTLPMLDGITRTLRDRYTRDTEQLLSSITVGGAKLFPGWAGHPSMVIMPER
jgi:hypothetical protein